jgi:hypothetical protein
MITMAIIVIANTQPTIKTKSVGQVRLKDSLQVPLNFVNM